jgi:hypothetical protein
VAVVVEVLLRQGVGGLNSHVHVAVRRWFVCLIRWQFADDEEQDEAFA